jgi:uncharacterized protein DUF262
MKRTVDKWTISQLRDRYLEIEFPEYQREPSLWSKREKQRLIDSILRGFDIASIYLSKTDPHAYDCIDGRQRINAIMAFLGRTTDPDDGFTVDVTNEIYREEDHPFEALNGMRFREIEEQAGNDEVARRAFEGLLGYEITVVLLSDVHQGGEFNLQFTRLNLGVIVNAGEKLNAMVGDMRDICFAPGSLVGGHKFLASVGVPGRRFAKELLGATIIAQIFEQKLKQRFTRTRHFDLQKFMKDYTKIGEVERRWVGEAVGTMDWLATALPRAGAVLRNRAMVVSVVLLAWALDLRSGKPSTELQEFLDAFVCRLGWQTRRGLDSDLEYRYLIDFQKHVTQASVEKLAVDARHRVLEVEFKRWRATGQIDGDAAYEKRTGRDPQVDCKSDDE